MPSLSSHQFPNPNLFVRWIPIVLLQCALAANGYALQADPGLPEDIQIINGSVKYSGTTQIEIFGQKHVGSVFSIAANVKAETEEGFPNLEVYEIVPAEFEIIVVEDKSKTIHDALIERIYDTWSKNKLYSVDLYYYYFSIKSGQYVLTAVPAAVAEIRAGNYFFWVNGRVFKVVFKSFKGKGGFGVVDSFASDNLRIRIANVEVKAYQVPYRTMKDFVKLYNEGFFKH